MRIDLDVISGAGGGGKGGGAASAKEEPNTLRSKARARFVEILSEGPIVGLVDGGKSIFIQKVPYLNPDGSNNFNGLKWDTRPGTPDQTAFTDVPGVPSEYDVGREARNDTPVTYRTSGIGLDKVVVTLNCPSFSQLDKESGSLKGTRAEIAIDIRSMSNGANQWVMNKIIDTIAGKQTGPYERAYEIALPATDPGPWLIRMRRLSPDYDSDASINNHTIFARCTEIYDKKIAYANTAMIAGEVDAQQFSGGAQRNYDIDGRLIRYPSNYNPTTGVYTGLWNGTFVTGYCKNPAWVFLDIVTHVRYGLEISDAYVDKWALYRLAQYCDALVPDGFGGQERRFEFNGTLKRAEDAYKVLQQIASMMRAIIMYGAGAVLINHDYPKQVVATYSPANIINNFSYASTAKSVRHNAAIVKWRNPELGYEDDYEIYQDRAAIIKYGRNIARIEGFATKSRGQAFRQAKWLVLTEQLQSETVTFEAGLDSADRLPGDLIEIADHHKASADFAGRIIQPDGRNLATPVAASAIVVGQLTTKGDITTYDTHVIPNLIDINAVAGTGTAFARFPTGYTPAVNKEVIASLFVNPKGCRYAFLRVDGPGRAAIRVDFDTGLIDWKAQSAGNIISAGLHHVDENVYRVWIAFKSTVAAAMNVELFLTDGIGFQLSNGSAGGAAGAGLLNPLSVAVGGVMVEDYTGQRGPSKYELKPQATNKIILDRQINYIGTGFMGLTLVDGPFDDVDEVASNTGRPARRKVTYVKANITSFDNLNNIVNLTANLVYDDKATPVIWVYSSATIAPKPYVVVEVEPQAGEKSFKISALEYSVQKFIDLDENFNITFGDDKYSNLPATGACPPVSGLRATVTIAQRDGLHTRQVILGWEKPANYPYISHYIVNYQEENGNFVNLGNTADEVFEINNFTGVNFRFSVRAVNVFGIVSPAVYTDLNLNEDIASNRIKVTSLTSELGNTQFVDNDINLFWLSLSSAADVLTSSIFGTFIRSGGSVVTSAGGVEVTGTPTTNSDVAITVDTSNVYAPTITLAGTVKVGDSVTLNIGPTEFKAQAGNTTLSSLVAALTTLIDADTRYVATRSGTVITLSFIDGITNATNLQAHNDPTFYRYRVQFMNAQTSAVLRTEYTTNSQYVYTIAQNRADFGGTASRIVKVGVAVETQEGVTSINTEATFTNPAPTPPVVSFDVAPGLVTMRFTSPTDTDYAGVELHLSTAANYTPDPTTLVYKGLGNPVVPVQPGQTLYARYRFLDRFGEDGIAFSAPFMILTPLEAVTRETLEELRALIDEQVADAETSISDLYLTFGSSANAADSAFGAEQARQIAEAATALAVNARDEAVAAATAVSGASVGIIETMEYLVNDVEDSAQITTASAMVAQSSEGRALISEGKAAISETNADGSASAAATSAQVAATASNAASGAAGAAITSSQNAAASANAAGAAATAAVASVVEAQTAAGAASTSKNAAATSATTADGHRVAAAESAYLAAQAQGAAAGNANIAANQAVIATDKAALATTASIVAASYGGGSMIFNTQFTAWPQADPVPTYWSHWQGGAEIRTTSTSQKPAVQQSSVGSDTVGFLQQYTPGLTGMKEGWYVLEATVELISGSLVGSGVYFRGDATGGVPVADDSMSFSAHATSSGAVVGAGVPGATYNWNKVVRLQGASIIAGLIIACTNTPNVFGAGSTKTLKWLKCSVRPATEAEISGGAAMTALSATVSQHTSALATATQTLASLTTTVQAQGASVTSSANAVNGLYARASTNLDVNGYMTGWTILSTGQVGYMDIHSDYFSISKPGGGARTEFSNGNWRVYDASNRLRVKLGNLG